MSVGRGILMSSIGSQTLFMLCNIDLTRVDIRDFLTRAPEPRLSRTNSLVIPLEGAEPESGHNRCTPHASREVFMKPGKYYLFLARQNMEQLFIDKHFRCMMKLSKCQTDILYPSLSRPADNILRYFIILHNFPVFQKS